ncbi:MAG TPA: hypothetical protein PLY93_10950 [Turneriella sp.]|nr:hypothetical protein [Turneriella sp.]
MNTQSLISNLKRWQPTARERYKTELVGLFGSWASLFDWVALAQAMENEFHPRIDLVLEKNFKPRIKKYIEPELIQL